MDYTRVNAETWDRWSSDNWVWTVPVTHEAYVSALKGEWEVLLTPTVNVPKEWFGDLTDKKVLGLASGGGQQGPVLTAAGADVTIMDLSDAQLATEKMVAEREGYAINLVKADMTQRFPFADDSFDVIFHPVSNCYVADIAHVWRECFRVLKAGGRLLAGFTNPDLYLFNDADSVADIRVVNKLPYDSLTNLDKPSQKKRVAEEGYQFSHTMERQIGDQLKAGFLLKDFYEDFTTDDSYTLSHYFPLFFASLAVKPADPHNI